MLELSKRREAFTDLAPMFSYSLGTAGALVQEIILIYPLLALPAPSNHAIDRVCNAIALLQTHSNTRWRFLTAHIPPLLHQHLKEDPKKRQPEYLRLMSLGVISTLVRMGGPDVMDFLRHRSPWE